MPQALEDVIPAARAVLDALQILGQTLVVGPEVGRVSTQSGRKSQEGTVQRTENGRVA